MERFNHLNDFLFLKYMGEQGDEEQLLAFLNAVLGAKRPEPIKLVRILENKTFSAAIVDNKTSIFDVRAATDQNEQVNIEVQLKNFHNMEKRTLVHWSREYLDGIEAGDNYKVLPKVITINIVNFDYIKLDEFHTCFHLREDTHNDHIMTDVLEVHFLNMVKFRKLKHKDIHDPLERWMTFFNIKTPETELQEVINMDMAIQKAFDKIKYATQDKELLRQYYLHEMALSDRTTEMDTALEKQAITIAQNALDKGATVDFISAITGLSKEIINALK